MIIFILLATLNILITIPIVAYKLYKAFRIKNKAKIYRSLSLLVLLILLPGFLWRKLPGSDLLWKPYDIMYSKSRNKELTGYSFIDGDILYSYETPRDFNGDGYSIWISSIDDETADVFRNPKESFFSDYPKSEIRAHWESEFWKKTPFNKSEQQFLDFANTSLDKFDFELEDLLNEEGNYYAYEYYLHEYSATSSNVGNIDFYIICPERKLIIKINHNT